MEAMLKHAQDVLRMEAEAILELVPRVDENFAAAVKLILDCQGRTVITGMGKSGLIGRKMAATFASTGTPSFYLHPAEGIHGDLGMVTESDVVIALSNSGETGEVLNILPSLRRIGAKIIAMVGKPDSTLGKNADVVCRCQQGGLPAWSCSDKQHDRSVGVWRCAGFGAAQKA